MLVAKSDRSIERPDGDVVLFSLARFEQDIVRGGCCFICGASRERKAFNNEHVLPRWMLRRHNLHNRQITLANGSTIPYHQYTLPCCVDCNSALSAIYEDPVSRLFEGGLNTVSAYVKEHGPWLLFSWLALLFIKTHLKDWSLRLSVDRRSGDLRKLGHLGDVGELHHIHCVARSMVVGSRVEAEGLGTLFILAADTSEGAGEQFDYGDLLGPKSVMLKSGNVALVAVLDDACAAYSMYRQEVQRLTAPLTSLQLREILANVSYIAVNLEERPIFFSRFDPDAHVICGNHPATVTLRDPPYVPRGELLDASVGVALRGHPEEEFIRARLREGRFTFLFGPDGKQITCEPVSWVRVPP
jgi:hypothetical protein